MLVHGAWCGAWCWEKVAAVLKTKGHRVEAIDLPGHGEKVDIQDVTLAAYCGVVVEAIDRAEGPVVLVGHSMGGVAITGAAEVRPERVLAAVYVTAFLLPSGKSIQDYSSLPENAGSLLQRAIGVSADKKFLTFDHSKARETVFADCSEPDFQHALRMLGPQPLRPVGERGLWTPEKFGRVRKVYVKALQDRAIMPNLQAKMIQDTFVDKVEQLDSSHMPLLSMPEKLAEILARA